MTYGINAYMLPTKDPENADIKIKEWYFGQLITTAFNTQLGKVLDRNT